MARYGKARWMINSAGPDNNIECCSYWSREEVFYYGLPAQVAGGARFALYDPTNGTSSEGEIMRWNNDEKLGAL